MASCTTKRQGESYIARPAGFQGTAQTPDTFFKVECTGSVVVQVVPNGVTARSTPALDALHRFVDFHDP